MILPLTHGVTLPSAAPSFFKKHLYALQLFFLQIEKKETGQIAPRVVQSNFLAQAMVSLGDKCE